jgi:hypothetical protein
MAFGLLNPLRACNFSGFLPHPSAYRRFLSYSFSSSLFDVACSTAEKRGTAAKLEPGLSKRFWGVERVIRGRRRGRQLRTANRKPTGIPRSSLSNHFLESPLALAFALD